MDHDRSNDECAREHLDRAWERADALNRPKRIERSQWLEQFPMPPVTVSRLESGVLLTEARECYVFGQFIAVQLLAIAYVEHSLMDMLVDRGMIKMKEGKLPSTPLAEIFELAEKAGLIDAGLRTMADQVRKLRNPLTHRRQSDDEHSLTDRFAKKKRHPDAILEEDAQKALRLMFAVFERVLRFEWRSLPLW